MDLINDFVWHALLIVLCAGNLAAVLLGLLLLVAPDSFRSISLALDRKLEFKGLIRALNRPRAMERHFYRHHRPVGFALLAGSLFVLDAFLLRRTKEKIAAGVKIDMLGLLDAGVAFLVIGAVVAAIVGAFMAWRPSLLREIEAASNQWMGVPVTAASLSRKPYLWLDKLLAERRKSMALVLVFGGAYSAFKLSMLLFDGTWRI